MKRRSTNGGCTNYSTSISHHNDALDGRGGAGQQGLAGSMCRELGKCISSGGYDWISESCFALVRQQSPLRLDSWTWRSSSDNLSFGLVHATWTRVVLTMSPSRAAMIVISVVAYSSAGDRLSCLTVHVCSLELRWRLFIRIGIPTKCATGK